MPIVNEFVLNSTCNPTDFTVLEDAEIGPWIVVTVAFTVKVTTVRLRKTKRCRKGACVKPLNVKSAPLDLIYNWKRRKDKKVAFGYISQSCDKHCWALAYFGEIPLAQFPKAQTAMHALRLFLLINERWYKKKFTAPLGIDSEFFIALCQSLYDVKQKP